jgi:PAS domain S-box-containing protein
MKDKANVSLENNLRQKVEEFLQKKSLNSGKDYSDFEIFNLVNELELHQIELEMQNEELDSAKIKTETEAEKYTNLYDFAPSGYFILSKKGEILELNFNGASLLGKERSQLLHKRFAFFIANESKPTFYLFIEELFKKETRQTCEIVLSSALKINTHVYLTGIVTDDGEQCFLTVVDITNRKKAEETLKIQLLLQSTLESQVDTIIFSIDKEYNYLSFNKAHSDVMKFAYNADIKVGMNILDCISSIEDRKIAKENYDRALAGETHSNIRVFGDVEKAHFESFFNPILDVNHKIIGATGLARNITKRIQNEENLRISEEKYRILFESNRDSITLFRLDKEGKPGNFIEANPATKSIFGYTKKDILTMSIVDLEIVSDINRASLTAILLSEGRVDFETIIKNKKGEYRYVEIESKVVNYLNEPAIMNITRDITERKQNEENTRKAQENLTTILEAIPDLLFEVDFEGRIYYYQGNRNDLLAVPESEFIGKKFKEIIPADAANVCLEAIQEALNKGWSIGKQYSLDLAQGKCWFELSVSPINEPNLKTKHFIMLARDITARIEAQEALLKSQEKLQGIFNVANSGIVMIDKSGKFLLFNDWCCKLLGYTRTEFQELNATIISHPDDLKRSSILNKKIIDGKIEHYQIEKRYVGKDGSAVWCEISASSIKDQDNNVVNIIGVIIDITERKKAKMALHKSEARLIETQRLSKLGSWETDFTFKNAIWSRETARIYGIDEKATQFTLEEFLSIVHPEDRLLVQTEFVHSIKKHSLNRFEHRIITPAGIEKFVEQRWKIVRDNKEQPIHVIGSCLDITERKLAEEKLIASENILNQTQIIAKLGSFTLDFATGKWTSSAVLDTIFGIDDHFERNNDGWQKILHPDWREKMNDYFFNDVIAKKINFNNDYKIIKFDSKEERWVQGLGEIIYNKEGQPQQLIGSIQDITDRKLAEEKLIASEHFLNQTQTIANLGSYSLDFATGKWTSTSILDQIFGINTSFVRNIEGWISIIHPEWQTIMNVYLNDEVIGKKKEFNKDYKIIKIDSKEERWVHGMGEISFGKEGYPLKLIGSIQDITERKLAEEQISKERQLLRTIIDNIPDSIYAKDTDCRLTLANKKDLKLIGANSEAEVLGKSDFDFYPKTLAEKFFTDDQTVMTKDQAVINKEEYVLDEKGKKQWLLTSKLPLKNNDNTVIGMVGIGRDITEQKQVEEAIIAREQNYRELFNTSTDSIFIHDINTGIILDVNETMLKTFGYDCKEEIIGSTVEKLSLNTESYTAKAALNLFQKTINEEKQVFEWVSRRKDGSTFWSEMMLKSIKIDGEDRILAVGRDITERKRTDEKLKLSSEKFQNLVNSIEGIVWEADANTVNFTYVSKQAERLLGFSVEEWYTDGFWANHLHPDDKDEIISYCNSQTKQMLAHDFSYRFICKKGKTIWLRDIVNVVVEDGKPRWLRGVMFDITHLKETNLLLSESEEKYRCLVENSPDGVVIYIEDKIAFINNEGLRMLGAKNKEEIIGKPVLQYVHPESLENIVQKMKEVHQENNVSELIEEKFITLDGIPFDVEIKAIPTLYEHKHAVQVIVHDITQRKQTALELNKINRVYALISQINNLIIRAHNQKELFQEICNIAVHFGKFRMSWIGLLNDNHKIITTAFAGHEKGYFKQSNITTILDVPEGRGPTGIAMREGRTVICNDIANDKMMKPWRKDALKRGYSSVISIPIVVRNKKIGAFNLYSEETNFFSSEEEISLLEKIILNIAFALETIQIEEDRKQTEEKIRQLSQAVEQSPVTIVITNINGEIEYANPKFVETTGYTIEEVVGKNPRFLKSGHTSTNEYTELWQTLSGGKEWHGEFHNKKKDGSFFWESATISPIINAQGESTHFIAIKEDITERKIAEQELINAKLRAEESDRLKLAFLANMSHEIRTPMNGILGFTELLKAPHLTGDEQQEYINIIEKSGKRMLNIINDIISISKIESGLIEVSLSETNINEEIKYIHNFFQPETKQKGIHLYISKELPTKYSIIKTDREKLYAILSNLVKNAIKFTNEGGIEFGCEKKGKNIEFFVKDSGIGISNSQKNVVFERFRQANETISRSHEGSGLGLAISKAYVEMLGGKIRVESEEGKGSTFYFTIPYNFEPELQEKIVIEKTIRDTKEENKINNLKVLIVEDDAISKLLITIAVKPYSKEILKVSNGFEAIEACRNNPDIDLVMMDINMPELCGYEATKQIREFNKDLVIIAQTANGMQSDRDEAIASGCTDYISKPINIIDLSKLIHKYFNK